MKVFRTAQLLLLALSLLLVLSGVVEAAGRSRQPKDEGTNSELDVIEELDDDDFVMMRGSNGTRHRRQVSKGGSPIRYCLGDLSLCRNYPKRSTGDIWICMRELIDYISNRHCREYVEGFYLCMKDINEEDSCTQDLPDWSTTVRHCMRAKHPSTISDECKSTSFYRNCRNDLEENEVREFD